MSWHDLFSDIYILSLIHKDKRKELLRNEFERIGIDSTKVKWISAMNGAKPEIRQLVERLHIIEHKYLSFFTNGHLGCLFSHYSLWMQLYTKHLNENLEDKWYLIMEDDTKFFPCVNSEFIHQVWNEKPADANLVKFHATYGFEENPDLISEECNTYYRKQTRISFSLMCYAVHSSFFPNLLFTKWKNHIDLFHAEGIYILKTPSNAKQTIQTLYSSNGIFAEGICLTNHDVDSDTADSLVSMQDSNQIKPVQQLYDGVPPAEGNYNVHIYDKFQPTGTCHVYFDVVLKNYLK
jgi:GR25 family glycosyltransferase involved in LPS biosynthesis